MQRMLQWGLGFLAEEMTRSAPVLEVPEVRFNGASAFWPRKYVEAVDSFVGNRASMGPRLFGRGNKLSPAIPGPRFRSLQWGLGFLAEEIPWLFPSASTASALQWGLGFLAEEIVYHRLVVADTTGLQWGLGFLAEEITADLGAFAPLTQLQWGLGFLAEEMPTKPTRQRGPGHASMGPRLFGRGNACGGNVLAMYVARLQWGLGFLAEEMQVDCYAATHEEAASMGPRLFGRGNTQTALSEKTVIIGIH